MKNYTYNIIMKLTKEDKIDFKAVEREIKNRTKVGREKLFRWFWLAYSGLNDDNPDYIKVIELFEKYGIKH